MESKKLPLAQADVIFVRVNREKAPGLRPREFVAWLVRCACSRYGASSAGGASAAFRLLLADSLIHASTIDEEEFRSKIDEDG